VAVGRSVGHVGWRSPHGERIRGVLMLKRCWCPLHDPTLQRSIFITRGGGVSGCLQYARDVPDAVTAQGSTSALPAVVHSVVLACRAVLANRLGV